MLEFRIDLDGAGTSRSFWRSLADASSTSSVPCASGLGGAALGQREAEGGALTHLALREHLAAVLEDQPPHTRQGYVALTAVPVS
jgi:hypothetical protein